MTVYYLPLLLIATVCLINIFSIFGRNSNNLTIWPLALFSLFFLIVHAVAPYYKYGAEFYRIQPMYDNEALTIASIYSLIFIVVLSVLYRLRARRYRDNRYLFPSQLSIAPKAIAALYIVGVLIIYNDYQAIQDLGGFEAYRADRIRSGEERGILRNFITVPLIAIGLGARLAYSQKKASYWLALVAMTLPILWYYFQINSRSFILLTVLFAGFLVLISTSIRLRFDLKLAGLSIGIIATALTAFLIIDQATQTRYSGDTEYVQERLNNRFAYMLDGAFGNDEAMAWLESHEHELAYGKTYAAAGVAMVPRRFWENKPVGGGPFLVNTIFPGQYTVGESGVSSYTTGAVVEARLNFGIVGVFLVPAILVWLWFFMLDRIAKLLARRDYGPRETFGVFAWLTGLFFSSSIIVYSEFLGLFSRTIATLFPLLVVYAITQLMRRRAQRKKKLARPIRGRI